LREWEFDKAVCSMEFDSCSSRLVTCYKDQGERGLAGIIAEFICQSICMGGILDEVRPDCICPIPASPSAIARRGFDHILPIAEDVAENCGVSMFPFLTRVESADQRELGREERSENMRDVFGIQNLGDGVPRRVLLIDDVFTTGATLDSASALLREAGVESVGVATLCRVW
jgi:ComF family protein